MMTGIGMPFSIFWVWALNALQNSMMLRPRWPSAGPIGGDGLAAPAGTCSLRYPATFFAMCLLLLVSGFVVRLRAPGERPFASHGIRCQRSDVGLRFPSDLRCRLEFLHLAELELDRGGTAEDRD